jgi:RNA polymerase sigma-70 factor (ECF subfamily)
LDTFYGNCGTALAYSDNAASAPASGPEPVADHELMLEYQRTGSSAALAELVARYQDSLLSFVARLARSRARAEDVVQQTWLKLIEVARRGRYVPAGGSAFRGLLFTIARNEFLDSRTRKHESIRTRCMGPREIEESVTRSASAATVDDQVQAEQVRELVGRALAELPPEQRGVLALWAHGHSIAHVTRVTRAPWDTVLSRKKYALAKLAAPLAACR